MIVYDLICSHGHHFEGWFENLEDLENQMSRQLLACPVCGDEAVVRLPSTFGVVKKSNRPGPPAGTSPENKFGPEEAMKFLKHWHQLSEQVEKEYDDVGARFAEEALKIHYGATEHRNIRGQSSDDQEKMLRKEGVEFFKLPLLIRKNQTSNEN